MQCRSYSGNSANSWRGGSSPAIPCSFSASTGVCTPAPYRLGTIGCFSWSQKRSPLCGEKDAIIRTSFAGPYPIEASDLPCATRCLCSAHFIFVPPQVTLLDRLPWQPRLLPVRSPFVYKFWSLIELEPAHRHFFPRFLLSPGRSSFVIIVGQLDMFN